MGIFVLDLSADHLRGLRLEMIIKKGKESTLAKVAVVGLGRLGMPMAALYAASGHQVLGIDVNASLIDSLNEGTFSSSEPKLSDLLSATEISFSSDYEQIADQEFIILIVPTPSDQRGYFSNRYIEEALSEIIPRVKSTEEIKTIVICSTVMPGSCDRLKEKYIDPLQNPNIRIAYSPEFIALGNVIDGLISPDMNLIGAETQEDRERIALLLVSVQDGNYPFQYPECPECTMIEAELAKIAINNYLSIKTAFANSIGELSTSLGASPHAVMEAVGCDSRIGKKFLKPGMVAQGNCIPRDTVALRAFSWDQNVPPFLSRSAEMIHDRRKSYLLSLAEGSRGPYAIVGLTYRPNTPVIEASLTVWIAEQLLIYKPEDDMKVWDPLGSYSSKLLEFSTWGLSDALAGSKTIILGDTTAEVKDQVYEYYNTHNVRIIDCWRA